MITFGPNGESPIDAEPVCSTSSSLFHSSFFWLPSIQAGGKELCQTSQISSDGDQSPTSTGPATPSTTTPIPSPRKDYKVPAEAEAVGPAAPVALPRQTLLRDDQGELADKLPDEVRSESGKSESNVSTKTSSSDSGIEDGKCTPTSDEEKVLLTTCHCFFLG